MDLIALLHQTFDDLEAKVKEIFADAAPEIHDTVTQVVGDAKQQATDLATQALADAEKDAKTVAAGATDVLETVDPAQNTVETDQVDGTEHDVPSTDEPAADPVVPSVTTHPGAVTELASQDQQPAGDNAQANQGTTDAAGADDAEQSTAKHSA